MSRKRPYIGPSDAQANADALARRGAPYSEPSRASFTLAWDWHRREPHDLRDAVRMARRAYADEVPPKLHDGPDHIGDDGTPRMTAKANGYIFGDPQASDRTDPDQLVSYYHSPFRATLDRMAHGDATQARWARIVGHVTVGSQGPYEAAVREQAHPLDAKDVAERALRAFLHAMTDMKLHVPTEVAVAESITAA